MEVNQKLQADTLKLNERLTESNTQLQQNIKKLTEQKIRLDAANKALGQNFDHSLELCYRIISTYHPGLGKETKAIVDLCRQMIDSDYFNPEEEHVLKVSAWLQNIGLLGISRELMATSRQSPESLNPAERRLIHNHPNGPLSFWFHQNLMRKPVVRMKSFLRAVPLRFCTTGIWTAASKTICLVTY